MHFEYIQPRDFDCSPARYAEYLRDMHSNAQGTLSKPEQQWPRGSSHDISRAIMAECEQAHAALALDFGLFDASGKLAGYARR